MKHICPTCNRPFQLAAPAEAFQIGDYVTTKFTLSQSSPAIIEGTPGKVIGYTENSERIIVLFKLPLLDFYNRTFNRTDGRRELPMLFAPGELIMLTAKSIDEAIKNDQIN